MAEDIAEFVDLDFRIAVQWGLLVGIGAIEADPFDGFLHFLAGMIIIVIQLAILVFFLETTRAL